METLVVVLDTYVESVHMAHKRDSTLVMLSLNCHVNSPQQYGYQRSSHSEKECLASVAEVKSPDGMCETSLYMEVQYKSTQQTSFPSIVRKIHQTCFSFREKSAYYSSATKL